MIFSYHKRVLYFGEMLPGHVQLLQLERRMKWQVQRELLGRHER